MVEKAATIHGVVSKIVLIPVVVNAFKVFTGNLCGTLGVH